MQKLKVTSLGVMKMQTKSGSLGLVMVESQKTHSIRVGLCFLVWFLFLNPVQLP